jgi:hypothetical protein
MQEHYPRLALDLRHACPVCGKPYQPGEPVLALASFCLGPSDEPRPAVNQSLEQSNAFPLGHHECVLPRLLTLLASFQPGRRFVEAVNGSAPVCPAYRSLRSETVSSPHAAVDVDQDRDLIFVSQENMPSSG